MGSQGQGRGPHGRKGPSAHQPREADRVTCALCLSVPTYGKRLLQLPTRGIFYAASLGRGEGQLLPVVCTRHHVLLVDELDAVDGAPEKGAVRGMAQPHPQPTMPPTLGTAGRLTGGHRRQAGTPRGSSTHARSRPGPRRSHSTPCSEHPVRPQRPGARSWSRGQMDDEVTHEPEHTRVHALSPGTLTASPHRSSLPHSTPSQSGRGMCCRAGGCLCGTPAPGSSWKEGRRGPGLHQARQRSGPGSPLESALWGSTWRQRHTHLPLSSRYRLLGGRLLPRQAHLNLPQLFPIASLFLSYTPTCRFYEDEDPLPHSRHSLEPSTKPGPLRCLRNVH